MTPSRTECWNVCTLSAMLDTIKMLSQRVTAISIPIRSTDSFCLPSFRPKPQLGHASVIPLIQGSLISGHDEILAHSWKETTVGTSYTSTQQHLPFLETEPLFSTENCPPTRWVVGHSHEGASPYRYNDPSRGGEQNMNKQNFSLVVNMGSERKNSSLLKILKNLRSTE